MNLLLDTHTIIWFLNGDAKLSKLAKEAIENPLNTNFVSIASIWEIGIKTSLNKFSFPKGIKNFLKLIHQNGFEVLPISLNDIIVLSSLEFIHKDPFDRLLVSQALSEKLILITKDENMQKYDTKTLW